MFVFFKVRSMLISAIMRKMTKLSNNARKQFTIGQITNLMSVDSHRMTMALFHACIIWLAPTTTMLCMIFIYRELGLAAFAGIGVLTVLVAINAIVISKYGEMLQREQLKAKDSRTKVILHCTCFLLINLFKSHVTTNYS